MAGWIAVKINIQMGQCSVTHLQEDYLQEQKTHQMNGHCISPPSYFGQSEALSYQMKRLETKIRQLDSIHKEHLDRPTLDDTNKEEAQIQSLSRDISEVCTNSAIQQYLLLGLILLTHC